MSDYELEEMIFDQLGKGEELGIVLAENLSVKEVLPDSRVLNRIEKNDWIVSINGELVSTAGLDILVLRNRFEPYLSMRVFKPRHGFTYHHVQIIANTDDIGLTLVDYCGHVVAIIRVDRGSLAHQAGMRRGDHFVHIQGRVVHDSVTAKELIAEHIQLFCCVTVLLERTK